MKLFALLVATSALLVALLAPSAYAESSAAVSTQNSGEAARKLAIRRFLGDDHHDDDHHDDHHDDDHHEKPKKKLTCIEKYKIKYASCDSEDEAKEAACERKAYRSFKNCKYGKWGCKDWCLFRRRHCIKYGRPVAECEEKYEECVEMCQPKKKEEHHDDDHDDDNHHDDHHDHHDD
ncbi:hypothetical protein CLOM_g16823 [Closterium sp. NIES-68]|nr:hypothetical protein CLOM_g16823 [Closterium sp. NIES-68]GJP75621.1 hypothetical protein CLOP_g6049 [Closterium sp. NIES-67]